ALEVAEILQPFFDQTLFGLVHLCSVISKKFHQHTREKSLEVVEPASKALFHSLAEIARQPQFTHVIPPHARAPPNVVLILRHTAPAMSRSSSSKPTRTATALNPA